MRRNQGEKGDLGMREEGGELQGSVTQPPRHPATQPDMEKEGKKRYTGIEKDRSPEAKDRWDNLREAGEKQVKSRPGVYK